MRRSSFFIVTSIVAIGCGSSAASNLAGTGASATGAATGTGGAGASTTSTSSSGSGGTSTSSSSSASSASTTSTSTSSSTSTSTSSTSASSSSGGVDGGTGSGDCKTDADCPSGQCVQVTPGGFRECVVPPTPATTCGSAFDQCCPPSKLCPNNEACDVGPLFPVCLGVQMPQHNECAADQCAKDVDCAQGQICALAGTLGLGIRACVNAHCKLDSDCTAHAGGECAPVQDPCCNATDGLFCVYPGNGGCRTKADCGPTSYCNPDATSGVASCKSGGPICPA